MGVAVWLSVSMSAGDGGEVAVEGRDSAGGGVSLRTEGVRLLDLRRKKDRTPSLSRRRGRPRTDEDDATGELGIVEIGAATMVVVGKNERNGRIQMAAMRA